MRTHALWNVALAASLLCLHSCTSNTDNSSKKTADVFTMPGEFEQQEAVWLGWQGYELYYPVGRDMIRELLPHVKVKIVTESDSVLRVCKTYFTAAKIDTSKLTFLVIPANEFWIRDHGATYTRN